MLRTKERLDEQMSRIVERNLLQEEETAAKRARLSVASSSHHPIVLAPQPNAVADAGMPDQDKRGAEPASGPIS